MSAISDHVVETTLDVAGDVNYDSFVLSYGQQRLWFLQQLEPESANYNIRVALRLRGLLNVEVLEQSLNEIVRRHETLRTTFSLIDGAPVQVIAATHMLSVALTDLSHLPETEREAKAQREATAEGQQPFNLSEGPLFRVRLLKLGSEEHVLLLTLHHIIGDGWSMGVLYKELSALYTSYASGAESPLAELPVQYADYAVWQRERLNEELLEEQVQYWREQLRGAPAVLELPTDRPRPIVPTYRGARQRVELSEELSRELKELSRGEGVTLFMTLLTAFQILLWRYTGQQDIVVGTPTAGRNRAEIEPLIGFFVNTLALRTEVSGQRTFRELLQSGKQVCLEAYAHQDLPFDRLVDELGLQRNLRQSPLVQVTFNLANREEEGLSLPGLKTGPLGNYEAAAKFDLTLNVAESGKKLVLNFIYNPDLFEVATIARLSNYFQQVLNGIVADPAQSAHQLTVLSAGERGQVLQQWNDTSTEYATDLLIHELIEQQAARTAESIALIYEQERLSYRELNERANRLGHYLQQQGVGPETVVGILLERSAEMVLALLGTLKAGGAYLPLDPSYPPERLRLMLADSGTRVLLTTTELAQKLGDTGSLQAIELDMAGAALAQQSSVNLAGQATAANLAYVIYTSGSTGTPKAAMNTHGAIRNRLLWMQEAYGLSAADCVLQKTPYSFDVSVWEFFWPLMYGARLAVARPEGHKDAEYLREVIAHEQVTTLHFVPSMLSVFLQHGDYERCRSVRQVICSGEALSRELVERFFEQLSWAQLHNLYGPSEAAVDVSYWDCAASRTETGLVPIGAPIANTQLYVLDEQLEPVAVRATGELYIGGVGVGRGYWQRPDLTAERFIPDPYGERGARLYRTGDRARYRADGKLEFLGRVDYQVKLRGQRIELGEIETALRQHESVSEVVVTVREGDGPQLIAYVVGTEGIDGSVLRRYLQARLPEYMVPAAFVLLEQMPLTRSGKVDRAALPAPVLAEGNAPFEAPRTPLETMLAELWCEALKLEQVSVHANFFELGGDSLKGAVLINKLQRRLGEVLYVVALFDAPTIAALATYLETKYPQGVARVCGSALAPVVSQANAVDETAVANLRQTMAQHQRQARLRASAQKNPSAIFILSPPRSGSTLLRVMLGGNPDLFAPPELELLSFDTMSERSAALSGRNAFSLEGAIRAVMELQHCDAPTATALIQAYEAQQLPVQEFYRNLQQWCGARRLVDKTPVYALELASLQRAEEYFENPLYVHLLRHPAAMINSFVEAKLDEVFFRYPHQHTTRELAELIWTICHQNIETFLREIPAERQHQVSFEALVNQPEAVARGLSRFLGVEFCEAMVEPYRDTKQRMTDGLHEVSRMHGDMKFFTHDHIDPQVAERWRAQAETLQLGEVTLNLAAKLSYATTAADKQTAIAVLPRTADSKLPLSFAQQRLWFVHQLQTASPFYNIPSARRLTGRLNVSALTQSLTEIVRRHESLRTTFSLLDEQPVQVIAEPAEFNLGVIDLSELSDSERDAELQRQANAEARRPFDLEQGPLFRARLLKLGAEEHVLLLTLHHIIGDGWSMGVLFKELSALYSAYARGAESPLAELPVQYADYAVWQREWLSEELLEDQVQYWREQLRGAPAVLELPTDRPRPIVPTYRGARQRVELSEELSRELKELSRGEGVTLFMTLLTAFQILLWRYTGQQDIVVGTPTAGRNRAEIEPLIGFFVNTLALRTEVSGQRTFREALRAMKQVCLEAYAHQDLPFNRLVDELGIERNLRQSPLVQVTFNLINREEERLTLPGLQTEPLRNFEPGPKFDLTLNVAAHEHGLTLSFIYNPDLFEAATIARLSNYFQQVLNGIVADPTQAAHQLTVLSAGEREQVLQAWNDTSTEYATDLLIHELFEQQAARTPDSIALVYEQERLSYRELNERANRLGHYLQQQGVGPETVVGILLERSAEMVLALLATLKAGGAYLPLDPSYPAERVRLMLADSDTRVLLTTTELAQKLGDTGPLQAIELDVADAELAQQSAANVAGQAKAANLAYVIYTSGSTGTPKAAMNTHGAIRNRLLWMQEAYGLSSDDCVLQKTPYSFDVSVWEFFWPLMYGARLAVARPEGHKDAEYLREVIAREQVTTLHFVPSMLSVFLQHGEFERCRSVRQVICSGEALSRELVERFFEHLSCAQLHNLYGPSEAAVDVSYWDCAASRTETGLVPIGAPIANTQLYVLDEQLEPVGVRATGELYIGGVGVGRGYWQQPALTAERFIPDPYGERGGRLYRTGDRARYRADGKLEFLGRVDYQVKLRGQRIELGEIETALRQHESVSEVVVTVREGDGPQLIAYVVGSESAVDSSVLRRYLQARLPEYMVPAAFVLLEQMPLTRSGKVDRAALPAPVLAEGNAQFEAPRTALETMLAELWCEALKLEQVSVHANFFELGGDSLKGAVLINKLQRRLGEVLYVVALFDAPTIAALATYLETKYPQGVARVCGSALAPVVSLANAVDETTVANLRETMAQHQRQPRLRAAAQKNPSAIFILSPPRSGSTLLRVMLGGSPSLFAPPELELLSFDTMSERSAALSGRNAFSLEGAIRAVMELQHCDAPTATALIEAYEAQQLPVQEFYRNLQQWCGARRLVDKTPVYALELETLRRAEEYFENPLYVHLLRHPAAMINSFVEAKLDEVFFRYPHQHTTRELAELIWTISHQNIETFLRQIPAERQHQVSFEALVNQPEVVAKSLSQFLGVEFCEAMVEPYRDTKQRMTDGLHEVSRMHGDMKFFTHDRIDPQVAERWRTQAENLQLADITVSLAASLGYVTAARNNDAQVGKQTAIEALPRTENTKLHLSFAQQRLWFLDQLQTGSSFYNIASVRRLNGALNVSALAQSLTEIVRRHESLRTTFSLLDEQPVQIIAEPAEFKLAVIDLSELSDSEREAELQRQANAEARRPFDLEQGPLFRARLLKLADEEHVLLLTLHHIISDGWSMGLLFKELSALYSAYARGANSPLAELPVQYADFAVWQREQLSEELLEAQVKYWCEQLRGAPAVLELPIDRPRPAVQTHRGQRQRVELGAELSRELKELSRGEGVTLFMTLLAAFQILLWRWTGQQDIVVGTPTAGRSRAEIEPLIGFFVNTLALRTELRGQRTFREILPGVKQICLEAYAHQDLPFDRLVDELGLQRNLRQSPLVQVTFNLTNREEQRLTLPGLQTEPLRNFEPGAKFDLTLNAAEHDKQLILNFIYNPDLFEAATMERLAQHFQELLSGIIADPAQSAHQLTLLSASEREQVLQAWNDTSTDYGTDALIHELFEQQTARTPESIALVYEQERLSYWELNERANRLAHYLRQQGVGPETVVGILLERSAEMVLALLGTLKAGGAYLPLDPSYPAERLRLMLADSGTRVLLTTTELAQKLGDTGPLHVLELDMADAELAQQSAANVAGQATAANLAYVIYTSGSTGTPKAAMNTHGAIRNRLLWMQEAYGLSAADCVLQKTPYSFDVSVWEFFWPLMYGARLAVARPEGHKDAEYLREVIAREQVTTLHFVPSMLSVFLQHGDFEPCRSVRQVICSGEALSRELVERFFEQLSWARLHNLYGPSEAAVDVSYWDCAASRTETGLVPIGAPIANTQLYVLDEQLEPVGVRATGELYIGGVGVGRGYWQRPDLTAERFIPDPYGERGARLYRTGDRARYRADGKLEFLGRVDYQVKLRGQRIELGEIETALRQHESVSEVVVTVREGDGPQLIAYVVGTEGVDGSVLRRYLQARLPEYMVPAAFVLLEQMPLTRSGKVDRAALPAPVLAEGNVPFEAPRTPLEAMLAELWCEALKLEQVSVHANFFELGGDSLKGAVLINKLQRQLGEVLYVVALFDAPTIAALATYLETKYPQGVARVCGSALTPVVSQVNAVDELAVANLRQTMAQHQRQPRLRASAQKNPSAIFILSPPRSGSTLLRVMLGGSPGLFAPPELELLSFDTMSERSAALSGRNAFSLEGAIRAVMELQHCDAPTATALIQANEAQQLPVQEFYRNLQQWCGARRLVDKTPVYALELATLRRAEEYFDNPLYVHLLRHPAAMINSFVEAKLDEVFFRYPHQHTTRELAELIWTISHQNIETFLREIPAERQHQVSFEALVNQPEVVARSLSQFLGVEFCEAMVEPYRDTKQRMTDGLHEVSRMHGDMKFFTHDHIDPQVAERWRAQAESLRLGDVTLNLAAKLGYATTAAVKQTAIEPLPRTADTKLQLSFAQQRLWFLDQLQTSSPFYNIVPAQRLTGPLNVSALAHSLTEIVRRHESLRTTFSVHEAQPVQVIAEPGEFNLPVIDLSELSDSERDAELQRQANAEARRPFDLEQGPLFRARLLKLAAEEHVLLLGLHHIISDGWSLEVLFRELAVLYNAFSAGQPSPLADLTVQYADYAAWQQQYLQGEVLERELAYWKAQLEGAPAVLELPTDRPHPAVRSYEGATEKFSLPAELSSKLKALSQDEGVTLFMTLLAAFQVFLARYSGQQDIVVGTPIAGRTRTEEEALIGLFVNTLALRVDVSGGPTFREVLARVRETCLGAYAHQEIPFEKLVQELRPERSLRHSPLFQVFFQLNAPRESLALSGLSTSPYRHQKVTAKFDLTLALTERSGELRGSLEYNSDLFDASTAARLIANFTTMLQAAVAAPDSAIDVLPLLSETDRRQVLIDWNDTSTEYTTDLLIHELIEQQVARAPESIALVYEQERLSYRELNERANRLAHYLGQHGVGPEAVVGILLERSAEMVIALLATLKAGGAYLPLDPSYPAERLRLMLADSGTRVLLTTTELAQKLGDAGSLQAIELDVADAELAQQSSENFAGQATAANLAYVIYTSGSTGTPKAAMNTHGAIRNRLLWMQEAYGLSSDDCVLQKTPYSFDVSVWEFFWPLMYGARLAVARPEGHKDAEYLREVIAREQVTTLHFVPSMLSMFLQHGDYERCRSVRQVICSGEALSRELVERFFEQLSWAQLHNLYGPSEAAVDVSYWDCTASRTETGLVPIGAPIANTQLYVLDEQLEPVGIRATGELYIGGVGVGRGYWQRPDLTAERFIPDPYGERGARLYRTGDRARYRADGKLEFLGRVDYQVKLRGQRIELGEIETALRQHESVSEVVVTVREGDGPQLIAYVVGSESAVDSSVLRRYLQARLPEYMVPNLFVALEQLPLTANGKVDRRKLPAPAPGANLATQTYTAPRTETEHLLCGIWSRVLKVDEVGIHDNFFELGGHSLLATQLVSQLRKVFGVEIALRTIFETPTVAGLAQQLETARAQQAPPIVPVSRVGDLPLSFAQQRLWFLDQLETSSSFYNIASARRLNGPVNVSALAQSLTEIVRRHESLRTTFSVHEEQPFQVIAEPGEFNLTMIDLSELSDSERDAELQRQANAEARRPFDLEQGPLFRARLLKLAAEEHVLLLGMHHIISDGWSLEVLFRELAVLYNAFSAGQPAPLADLSVQYADYAAWQQQYLQGEVLERELAYWKGQLEGAPAVLELPTDRPHPAVRSYEGTSEKFSLPAELSGKLKALSHDEGVTLFMTLLAAFQVFLARYSGQQDIVVGTPIAGRTRAEEEVLIGLFVNTLALRVDLSGEPTFREVLARVRETCLGAYAHQEIPFEKLVQELRPERSLRHSPLFQVFFQLNAPRESLALSGLNSKRFKAQNETAKFDLTLVLNETADGLAGSLEYSTDLFDPATASRIIANFSTLLSAAVAAPDTRLNALPMLTQSERQQLLQEWNHTRRDFPLDQGADGLFEQQVERTPEAIALISDDEFVNYRELNERANRLAHYLMKQGIGPESLVGVLLERSADTVVALLAVLKAGAAYLPLDTSYPAGRLAVMLEDAKAEAVITREESLRLIPATGMNLICLDREREQIEQEGVQNPVTPGTPGNRAYTIFTSGSTGRPKGVEITRSNLENFLRGMMEWFPMGESDLFAAISTICFDISYLELFVPLLSGARLLVVSRETALDGDQLAHTLEKYGATIMEATPTSWRMLIESGWRGQKGLRALCGGEVLPNELAEALLERGCQLFNLYGPTETTIWSTGEPVKPDTRVTIGRAVANTHLYVVDAWMQPVPIGVTGELYIGGAGVARGYVGAPALTAARFVPDPWSGEAGTRLYRTGDLVRWRADGRLECHGRADQQVKIRGHRIEPVEVEEVLNEHELVRASVVVPRDGGPGLDQLLVAYVVPAFAKEENLGRVLRRHLQDRLPDYLVPNVFVELAELPRTSSGKVDRRALPEPPSYVAETVANYEAPRTAVEEVLCCMWAEVLQLEQVGINDNFFELGGHSLLATRLLARVQNAFEVRLLLRSVFEAPTVLGMAQCLFNAAGAPLRVEKTAQVLLQLSQMSEAEAEAMLDLQLVA